VAHSSLSASVVSKLDALAQLVLLVVFEIDERPDGVGSFALVHAKAHPHLESVHLLARETLIHYTNSQDFLVVREAVSDEVLDELLPNRIQKI
jgi:hypothetical protein